MVNKVHVCSNSRNAAVMNNYIDVVGVSRVVVTLRTTRRLRHVHLHTQSADSKDVNSNPDAEAALFHSQVTPQTERTYTRYSMETNDAVGLMSHRFPRVVPCFGIQGCEMTRHQVGLVSVHTDTVYVRIGRMK